MLAAQKKKKLLAKRNCLLLAACLPVLACACQLKFIKYIGKVIYSVSVRGECEYVGRGKYSIGTSLIGTSLTGKLLFFIYKKKNAK